MKGRVFGAFGREISGDQNVCLGLCRLTPKTHYHSIQQETKLPTSSRFQSFLGSVDARRVFLWTLMSDLHLVHFTVATAGNNNNHKK